VRELLVFAVDGHAVLAEKIARIDKRNSKDK
jgi:hypothetical protein